LPVGVRGGTTSSAQRGGAPQQPTEVKWGDTEGKRTRTVSLEAERENQKGTKVSLVRKNGETNFENISSRTMGAQKAVGHPDGPLSGGLEKQGEKFYTHKKGKRKALNDFKYLTPMHLLNEERNQNSKNSSKQNSCYGHQNLEAWLRFLGE